MLVGELKGLLSLKIKSRHDGYSDQFNRIFIIKILMVCSLLMGINWYKDSVNCIVPGSSNIASDFVSSACWIQGVYVYSELKDRVDEVAYYGIPKSIDSDGMLPSGHLCSTQPKAFAPKVPGCKPLTKTFFLQYQWMPFYIGALAILYYIPYVLHIYGNSDMISLKGTLKSGKAEGDKIVDAYFNHRTNPVRQLRTRVMFNYFIKLLYIIANLVAFFCTDRLLLGKFRSYGVRWVRWSKLENSIAYDYMGTRDFPKPGHELLPPFGYCELYEASKDIIRSHGNRHKFVCELSQNILYQYCLLVIWFVLIFGIIISCVGFLLLLLDHVITLLCVLRQGTMARKMYNVLTLRECEYLEFIRRRDIPLYAEVVQKLRIERYHMGLANGNGAKAPCETPPPEFNEVYNQL